MTELSKRLMATGLIEWRWGMVDGSEGALILCEDWDDDSRFQIVFASMAGFHLGTDLKENFWPDLSHAGTRALVLEQLKEKIEEVKGWGVDPNFPFEFFMDFYHGGTYVYETAESEAELLVKIAEALGEL